MPFTIIDASGSILTAKISGELSKSEVSQMQAGAAEAIRRWGKIKALLILDGFRGWSREGDWGDVTFMSQHDKDIAKIAVVGDEEWKDLFFAFLAKGFRQAAIEYFPPGNIAKARAWLEAEAR